ncbi:hypothetical protein C8J27_1101 [Rhodobacter aestuarii]|uniref:Uncharacterized protein n=1 Tax=Rhodobacter aestuarii TaxID=453582 RepID=A0A1N7PYP2_9RHOB|nr:hypothetical protein [Rhodobacter aestuarii]PTV93952.1 hypothetical protein C8J27_1101 [Rhodobacter aestuarii]SIT15706.1 hypothetical protein SAMN05421580_1121 [Rhodobacter aestuarii]
MGENPQWLENFLEKTSFDFSKAQDWRAFLNERREGGSGRSADGLQLRDIKNYAPGTAFISTHGAPTPIQFHVRTQGSGFALPSGVLHVYHPDASWTYKVTSFYVGPPTSSLDFRMEAGGGGSPSSPMWGSIYYIVLKSSDLPGQKQAETIGKRALREAVKGLNGVTRWGFRLLAMGEASYSLSVKVGGGEWVRDEFMPQQALTEAEIAQLKDLADQAYDYLRD